jgi:hypothetical protein
MKNWEKRIVFRLLDFFWFWEFGFGVLVNHCRGHQVAGRFGLGGQDSFWYPGARELDRLLLDGWVVSRFWAGFGQCIRLGKAAERMDKQINEN